MCIVGHASSSKRIVGNRPARGLIAPQRQKRPFRREKLPSFEATLIAGRSRQRPEERQVERQQVIIHQHRSR